MSLKYSFGLRTSWRKRNVIPRKPLPIASSAIGRSRAESTTWPSANIVFAAHGIADDRKRLLPHLIAGDNEIRLIKNTLDRFAIVGRTARSQSYATVPVAAQGAQVDPPVRASARLPVEAAVLERELEPGGQPSPHLPA
jgi:hypothetical protein